MRELLTTRHDTDERAGAGWRYASGLAVLLLLGVLLLFGVPSSPSDSTSAHDRVSHAALGGALHSVNSELAPPASLTLPQVTLLPKLSGVWLTLASTWLALVGWRPRGSPRAVVRASRFPPGRRGRALLHAYLN